jgi:peptide/nickel transport system substrate-binding protein
MKRYFKRLQAACVLSVAVSALMPVAAQAQTRGGVVSVAVVGEMPTFDPMASTADLVGTITQHYYETLFTFDSKWGVTPLLAAALPEISADGTEYVIELRPGVTFHNGDAMTSKDVVDSLKRWTRVASRGKQIASNITAIEAIDPSHVRIKLKEPYVPLLSLLAFNNAAAVVMPAGTPDTAPKQPIGTGPYMFAEYRPDQFLQLKRFDKYASRDETPDNYGGARHQYLDEIRFVPVPDVNTRIEGALAGQYDYADVIGAESVDRIKGNAEPFILKPAVSYLYVLNTKQGPFANVKLRQAMQSAMNMEDTLAVAIGRKEFYAAKGAIYPEGYTWHTTNGVKGNYNTGDIEKAAKLAKEAGYDGKPIRILATRQNEINYQVALMASEYLKAAGFKVDLQVMDWATLLGRRANPELWDVFATGTPYLPDPALIATLSESYPGWWTSPERKAIFDAMNKEINPESRKALWADLQGLIYEQAPFMKIGDLNTLAAKSTKLKGMRPAPWPFFWNAYKD